MNLLDGESHSVSLSPGLARPANLDHHHGSFHENVDRPTDSQHLGNLIAFSPFAGGFDDVPQLARQLVLPDRSKETGPPLLRPPHPAGH